MRYYPDTYHGFAVRGDPCNPGMEGAKEEVRRMSSLFRDACVLSTSQPWSTRSIIARVLLVLKHNVLYIFRVALCIWLSLRAQHWTRSFINHGRHGLPKRDDSWLTAHTT